MVAYHWILFSSIFFWKCFLKLMNPDSALKYVESAWEDYIRGEGDLYDVWLLNSKWQIDPSIAIVGGVPYVLTCREHNKHSSISFIHLNSHSTIFQVNTWINCVTVASKQEQ